MANSIRKGLERMIIAPKFWAFLFMIILIQPVFVIIDDVHTYYSNVNNPQSCCGYVDPVWVKRPYTHLKVDWTEPKWKKNHVGSEEWLVSDGQVDGRTHFWTVWERKQVSKPTESQKLIEG
ncbi:hypothetical protein [Vibrio sp. 10N.239.312.D08]|uniref:hypothetical protein n=1 Tax=Vibrio sp. 10N.239.312.D08 TaxID=3229978 RepID=UPI00354BC9EE